jgi:hypothetical protein
MYAVHVDLTLNPEDGQDIWPKHVGVVYNEYKNTVQLVGSLFVYTLKHVCRMHNEMKPSALMNDSYKRVANKESLNCAHFVQLRL